MALLEFGANPMASLAVCLLSSDREFSLKGVFGGHSMIFLWTLVGTVMPLEESSGVFLLFRQALGSGLMPPRLLRLRWVCSGSRAGVCPGWAFAGLRC